MLHFKYCGLYSPHQSLPWAWRASELGGGPDDALTRDARGDGAAQQLEDERLVRRKACCGAPRRRSSIARSGVRGRSDSRR